MRYACGLARTRRGKVGDRSEKLVAHVLTYMDDWLLIAHDTANLKSAVRKVAKYLRDSLGLDVKRWKVCRIDCEPIDMCGFVFRRGRTTVRAGIFLRARRAVMRADKMRSITPHAAARVVSYWGYFKATATRTFRDAHRLGALMERCKKTISRCTRKKVEPHGAHAQLGAA